LGAFSADGGQLLDFCLRQQKRAYEKQQKEIKRVQRQITVLKQWSDKAYREVGKSDNIKEFEGVKAKKIDKKKQGSASFSIQTGWEGIFCAFVPVKDSFDV